MKKLLLILVLLTSTSAIGYMVYRNVYNVSVVRVAKNCGTKCNTQDIRANGNNVVMTFEGSGSSEQFIKIPDFLSIECSSSFIKESELCFSHVFNAIQSGHLSGYNENYNGYRIKWTSEDASAKTSVIKIWSKFVSEPSVNN